MNLKNRNYLYFITFTFFFISVVPVYSQNKNRNNYIHPSFKNLLVHYPRDKKIHHPSVPRIHPKMALRLYRNQKAIFFYAGDSEQNMIPGSIKVSGPNGLVENPPMKLINKYKKNKIFIIYCH